MHIKFLRTNQFYIFVQINQGTYKDGTKSHKFGYIQFDNEDSAEKAIKEFNNLKLNDADEKEVSLKLTVFICNLFNRFKQYFLNN